MLEDVNGDEEPSGVQGDSKVKVKKIMEAFRVEAESPSFCADTSIAQCSVDNAHSSFVLLQGSLFYSHAKCSKEDSFGRIQMDSCKLTPVPTKGF